jgi:hypothetical protein
LREEDRTPTRPGWDTPLRVDFANNPFAVFTPEALDPDLVVSLFVHEISEYGLIKQPGHSFLNGPRGSGKSMIFRYLEPDCQKRIKNQKLSELEFYGAYVPIKRTQLNITEFGRLDRQYADVVLNEHILVLFFLIHFFRRGDFTGAFRSLTTAKQQRELLEFHDKTFEHLLLLAAWKPHDPLPTKPTVETILDRIVLSLEEIYSSAMMYMRRLSFSKGDIEYSGPLLTFDDFLFPFILKFKKLSFMPRGPIYFMIDDADKLTVVQAKIINTWIWKRVSKDVSFKLSTQFLYPTHRTVTDDRIETPHDFQSINISDIYTSDHEDNYRSRVRQIVERRLRVAGIKRSAYEFFPVDKKQEIEIASIKAQIASQWSTRGRGHRARDDANRYAVSEFIKSLGGSSKAKSKYSYAGFEQLVNVSSGVVRYFLDPADKMFERELMRMKNNEVVGPLKEISPYVQNDVIRKMSQDWYATEIVRRNQDKGKRDSVLASTRYQRLKNLIDCVGSLFHVILISDRSERRIFSLAINGNLDEETQAVMNLAVTDGFFHRTAIGGKDGFGRLDLYILTRRLAPYFQLDPNGVAGYFFIHPELLTLATKDPKKFLASLRSRKIFSDDTSEQLRLFDRK